MIVSNDVHFRIWLLADLLRAIDLGLLYPRNPTQDFIVANL